MTEQNTSESEKLVVLFPETSGISQPECSDHCSELGGQLPTILNEEENLRLNWQKNYHRNNGIWLGK